MAHEVNNMMTGVLGFSEFCCADSTLTTPAGRGVRDHPAGTRAADVTRQLLAFTRQQFLRPEAFDLNQIVAGMEKLLRRSLGEDQALTCGSRPSRRRSTPTGAAGAGAAQSGAQRPGRDRRPRGVVIATAPATRAEVRAASHGADVEVPAEWYVLLSVSDSGWEWRRRCGENLRAVLHHQARRSGHRARTVHRVRIVKQS
jgi:hypothetical protein